MQSEVRAEDIANILLAIEKTENAQASLASQQDPRNSLTKWRQQYKQNTSIVGANQCPGPNGR